MSEETESRIEQDSLGEVLVPRAALWGAQTQRAVDNIQISGERMPVAFVRALGLVKAAAASCNGSLGVLDKGMADAIETAALDVYKGRHDDAFVVGVYQTGSGTSSNMNANEVIATLASSASGLAIHPNDHVNAGQSSNDVVPTTIHVSAALALATVQAEVAALADVIDETASRYVGVVKTGRTHLMDAMPLSLAQELSAWSAQLRDCLARLESCRSRVHRLALGGTAVGTGVNAHPDLGARVAAWLVTETHLPFVESDNHFRDLACQDTAVELGGQLNTLATALMKISNDLRWMNSGPLTGLAEVSLPVLQPGSSIMPGKVNPVVPEAVAMACASVMGHHTTLTVAGQSGSFQLNVMLPVIARCLLDGCALMAGSARSLRDKVMRGLVVNEATLGEALARNPILVTALNSRIGYSAGAAIAKRAYAEGRPVLDVALEETDLSEDELRDLLDPSALI